MSPRPPCDRTLGRRAGRRTVLVSATLVILMGTVVVDCSAGGSGSNPAITIATAADYQKVWPGIDSGGTIKAYVAARAVGAGTDPNAAELDFLDGSSTGTPTPLITHSTADLDSVQMAIGPPDAVLWVDSVQTQGSAPTFQGTVMYANLSTSPPTAVPAPSGDATFPQDVFFGPNGNEMLYFSGYQNDPTAATPKPAGGNIFWWDTVSKTATAITPPAGKPNAPEGGIVLSQDHSSAIVALNYDGDATGDLYRLDMTNGKISLIDTGVDLFTHAYAKDYHTLLGTDVGAGTFDSGAAQFIRAYSVTPDCKFVAYTKLQTDASTNMSQREVFRWSKDAGSAQPLLTDGSQTAATGLFPGISPSGEVVAYWDFSQQAPAKPGDVMLRVWRSIEGKELYAAVIPTPASAPLPPGSTEVPVPQISMPAMAPIISPDDGLLVFVSDFNIQGSALGGELGTLWMLPVDGIPDMYKTRVSQYLDLSNQPLAKAVAYQSIEFGPKRNLSQPGQKPELTTLLSFLGSFIDATTMATLDNSTGSLFAVDVHGWPPVGFGPGEQLATNIAPGNVAYLPNANGLAYVAGQGGDGHPFVWVPGMTLPRDLELGNDSFKMIPGSFKTTPIAATATAPAGDAILYESGTTPAQYWSGLTTLEEGSLRTATIVTGGEAVGTVDTGVAAQNAAFFFATFSSSGRVIGIFDAASTPTSGGTGTNTGTSTLDGGTGAATPTNSTSTIMNLPLP